MPDFFKTKSLRFWIAVCMAVAIVPLALSAGLGYVLLNRGVIGAFKDVAQRQAAEIIPAQRLRIMVGDALTPVDEYVDGADATRPLLYRALRKDIEGGFASLAARLADDPEASSLITRARDDWTAADRIATGLISGPPRPGDAEALAALEHFHGAAASVTDKLSAVFDRLEADVAADHGEALVAYERSLWLAGIAAAVCLLAAVGGTLLIGRIIAASVDRLVDGASRFAEGEREHRIDVQVPPELHRVAEEFNRMAGRMHQSETLLADLAHRDGLTRLLNRRAFDESLAEMLARAGRYGETGALLTLDIDHFKRINDVHGHAAGDEALRFVAEAIASHVRPFDKVFRTGGEEFAVLIANADAASAAESAERLRLAAKARPARYHDTEMPLTVSVGVALMRDGLDPQRLTEAADAALYEAKRRGRDRVVVEGERTADRSAA